MECIESSQSRRETAKAFKSIVEGIVEQLEKGSQRSLRII